MKWPLFRIDGVNSDDVLQNLTPLPRSHFSTRFDQQTLERVFTSMTATSYFTFPFPFQSAHMNHYENRSLRYRCKTCWVYSHYRKAHSCIESTSDSILRSHTRPKLGFLLLFFQISCDIISNLNDAPIFAFSWRCCFGYHARIEYSITMQSVHHSKIFFWRAQNTTLTTIIESPLVSNKTCRTSPVVGVPSGRHSQLSLALSALHLLNNLVLLPHN